MAYCIQSYPYYSFYLKREFDSGVWWCITIIPATWEVETGRITVQSQLKQKDAISATSFV
jgi:hypothetical protein